MNYDINKLHEVQQEILDYFVSICEQEGYTYFLVAGTALGAYRHYGFIPWDDDLDVAMPRKDYERFLDYCKRNKSSKYVVQNEDNERNWFLTFSKIRKNNTLFIEGYAEKLYEHNGIYIDVFPIDYTSKQTSLYPIHRYLKHCLKFASCKDLYKRRGMIRYGIENIICFPVRLTGVNKMLIALNALCIQNDKKKPESELLVIYDDAVIQGIPQDVFFPPCKLEFEGKHYYAPSKICEYLTYLYGDTYMELPPENERATHEPIEIQY